MPATSRAGMPAETTHSSDRSLPADGAGDVRPWRLYDVTVRYGDEHTYTETVAAPSPAAARYRHFLDLSDVISDLTFAHFLSMSSVRLSRRPPDPDAYAHIRRAYGLDVRHGQRVAIRGEGAEYEGTVVHPSGSTHYVHVVLDGRSDPGLFHPGGVVPLALAPDSPANAGGRTPAEPHPISSSTPEA